MARKPAALEEALTSAAEQFALQIMDILKTATIEEIASLQTSSGAPVRTVARAVVLAAPAPDPVPAKRGRPSTNTAAAASPPAAESAPEPAKKERKKRVWPECTVNGCAKNVYMPSGALKMCYQHYIDAGGKESPLVRIANERKADKQTTADARPATKTRKTTT